MKITFSIESDSPDDLPVISDIATYAANRHRGNATVSAAPAAKVATAFVPPVVGIAVSAHADPSLVLTNAAQPVINAQDAKDAVAALAAEAVTAAKRKRRTKEEIARDEAVEATRDNPPLPLATEAPTPTPMPTQAPAISEVDLMGLLGDGDGSFTEIVPDEPVFETYKAWDRNAMWEHLRTSWNKALTAQEGAEFLRDTIAKYNVPAMSSLNEDQMRGALLEMDRRARNGKLG